MELISGQIPSRSQLFESIAVRMPKRRKKRPNWPYRLAWVSMIGALVLYIGLQTLIGSMTFGRRSYGTDWGIAFVASCLDATVAVWFVAVGASIGSFLNVVAYRLPLGRYIGGHSGCPFCQSAIQGSDNVPVLAWIKLRGRCRSCRLPISIQYPLVEFAVAAVFLLVFVTEFSTNGANLPGTRGNIMGSGLMRVAVTSQLVLRIVTYCIALSGLIAAGLIAVKSRIVPLKLYMWSIVPLVLATMIHPEVIVTRWREAPPVGQVEMRLDALATLICGAVAGVALARLLCPLIYKGFDRSLVSSDPASRGARQFVGAMAVAGMLFGWQAVVPLGWVMLVSALIGVLVLRPFWPEQRLVDMTIWAWMGVFVFRCGWSWWISIEVLPPAWPEVIRHILGALLLAPLALIFRGHATPAEVSEVPRQGEAACESESEFEDSDV